MDDRRVEKIIGQKERYMEKDRKTSTVSRDIGEDMRL